MFSPVSIEAQKLITVSIGKINASRVTRSGASLHRSLLVASVLHKARNVYLEEERERAARYCPPSPELTVTPVCHQPQDIRVNNDDSDNRICDDMCREDEVITPDNSDENRLPRAEAYTENVTNTTNTTTTVTAVTNTCTSTTSSSSNSRIRKRRRVSDQETAAAISSILPKRLRSENREEAHSSCDTSYQSYTYSERLTADSDSDVVNSDASDRLSPANAVTPSDESDSDGDAVTPPATPSDESDSDGEEPAADTSNNSEEEMEVDQLTSLVSYFSFSQTQQKPSDYCLSPLHGQNGPHIVALTA